MLFPKGKTKFVKADGSIGGSPGHGIVLLAMGERARRALRKSGLGLYVENGLYFSQQAQGVAA
jgi:hypothetical protein